MKKLDIRLPLYKTVSSLWYSELYEFGTLEACDLHQRAIKSQWHAQDDEVMLLGFSFLGEYLLHHIFNVFLISLFFC